MYNFSAGAGARRRPCFFAQAASPLAPLMTPVASSDVILSMPTVKWPTSDQHS
jgi:hypothetical protein